METIFIESTKRPLSSMIQGTDAFEHHAHFMCDTIITPHSELFPLATSYCSTSYSFTSCQAWREPQAHVHTFSNLTCLLVHKLKARVLYSCPPSEIIFQCLVCMYTMNISGQVGFQIHLVCVSTHPFPYLSITLSYPRHISKLASISTQIQDVMGQCRSFWLANQGYIHPWINISM